MGFLKWLIILIFQFYYLFYLTIAQTNFTFPCEGNVTEYPPNGTYHTNLNTILSSLSRNIDSDGFYNATIGQDQDRISAIAQCRADIELQTAPDFQTIHALVQCTADLSAQGCYNCLSAVYSSLPGCECYAKRANYHLMPSCIVWYEPYSFFNESLLTEAPPPLLSPPQPALLPPPPPPGKDDKTARTVIIIVVPIVTIVILIGCFSVMLMRRRKRKLANKREGISVDDTSIAESLQYDFSAISAATDNFSDANKLGQGGFGTVYKVINHY
ncbi:hypothetical protein H5410_064745 [Solanum commersonii]|uniref:Gnk2-homologous domain-containing protein n=1 Tax=Solanum commersonii TaxID=4109 RepID=A0A9J5VYI8_SOLCO|nr:hypothetical protein H5410_064745 [Solanum commersonii]